MINYCFAYQLNVFFINLIIHSYVIKLIAIILSLDEEDSFDDSNSTTQTTGENSNDATSVEGRIAARKVIRQINII